MVVARGCCALCVLIEPLTDVCRAFVDENSRVLFSEGLLDVLGTVLVAGGAETERDIQSFLSRGIARACHSFMFTLIVLNDSRSVRSVEAG